MPGELKFESQFDPKAIITADSIAVTLIRSTQKEFGIFDPKHALLAIEQLVDGEYKVYLTDLCNRYTTCKDSKEVVTSHWGHSYPTHVRLLEIREGKKVEFYEKSPTWVKDRDKADLMLQEIKDEHEGRREPPAFYLLGGHSLMTYLTNHERHGEPVRNCIHWALDKLRLIGVNLPQGTFNMMTDSSLYTGDKNQYRLKPYGMHELCDFIKLGRIEAIRRFYPPQNPGVDLNQLGWGDVGSVEFQLRNYTPLMIACGYGHWDIAKMFITEYGVDVTVQTKHGLSPNMVKQWVILSYNALNCAEKNVFGLTKISKDDDGRQEVINLIKAKMPQPLPKKSMCVLV